MAKANRIRSEHDVVYLPVDLFADRTLSVLEVMVRWLKEEQNLSYHEIALLLNRNDRTIWTVYSRVTKKMK